MTLIRKVAFACVASAIVALPLHAGAQTGPRNQDTYFTFSQAVELPNTTLPAGKYFFQLMDSTSNRHIVKVMSEDRNQLHATLLAIPFYSTDRPSDEPQVRFMETPATSAGGATGTNAIKVWFYPGTSTGHEFIYPRAQAMRLAQRTGGAVLTTKSETEITPTVADTDLTRIDRSGQETAAEVAARAETTTAQAEPAPAAQQPMPDRTAPPPADRDTERTDLPDTAGFLPLLALIGVGSVVGSRLLRRSKK
jgi:hypothetical protein